MKYLFLIFFLIAAILSFMLFPAFAVDETTTKIMVIEGKVICFDLPKEIISIEEEKADTTVGRVINRIDLETCNVDIDIETARCYIPQEYRDQIGNRLQPGVYVFLLKNIRRLKQTEWDIISVGTVVGAGQEYSHDIVKQASLEPSISPSIPPPEAAVVNKEETSEGSGEGGDTPPSPPPTPNNPPNEPTPPAPEPIPTPAPETTTIYVDPSGGNDSNSGSESSKLKTITKAIANASAGATINLVTGTYSASTNGEIFPITTTKNITLKGQGASTILQGDGTSRIISIDTVNNFTLDSLKITNGDVPSVEGIIAVVFVDNLTTGVITNCTFSNNITSGEDETITFGGCGSLTVSECTFENNTCEYGAGGMDWDGQGKGGTLNISHCTFRNNKATNPAYAGPAGLWIDGEASDTATVSNCTFIDNTSDAQQGGALKIASPTTTINNCTFTNNSITGNEGGGAIYICGDATVTINGSTFTGNSSTAGDKGGAIAGAIGTTTINNSTFKSNTGCAITRFGALNPTITNCSFYDNNKTTGGTHYDHYCDGAFVPTYYDAWDGLHPPVDPSPYNSINDILGNSGNTEVSAGDPPITGRIYDSVTGVNIDSPVVAIYNSTTNTQVAVTTDNPFTFNVDPGKYYFAVSKDGYAFPSQIVSSTVSGDHGDIFTASADPLTINIPMDPDGWLVVEKTCNKERVETGDIVTYRIKVQNKHWYKAVENVELVDELVNGFKYVDSPSFNLGTISANSTQTITYQVRVGSGIPPGRYKTSAHTRKSTTGAANSNTSSTEIEIIENPLFTKGTIIGKVFWDENGNGIQDNGESGIARAVIATEYGVVVETDEVGKYHIADVPAGNHLLKVDSRSFPAYAKFTTDNPYYVKITEGLLAKVNFGITTSLSLRGVSPDGIGTNDEAIPSEIVSEATLSSASASPRNDNPWVNNFFIVALGEGIVRNLDTSGNIAMMDKDDRYDDGVKVDGRLALYLKGKVLGKYLIKASIDTDRGQRTEDRVQRTEKALY